MRLGNVDVPGILLMGPHTDLSAHQLAHSELQFWGSSLKSSRYIRGGAELARYSMRAAGAEVRAGLFRDKSADRCHRSFVELSSHPADKHRQVPNLSSPLTCLTWFILLKIPSYPTPPNSHAQPKPLQGLFHTSGFPWLAFQTFLKYLKDPQTPKMQQLNLGCPC